MGLCSTAASFVSLACVMQQGFSFAYIVSVLLQQAPSAMRIGAACVCCICFGAFSVVAWFTTSCALEPPRSPSSHAGPALPVSAHRL